MIVAAIGRDRIADEKKFIDRARDAAVAAINLARTTPGILSDFVLEMRREQLSSLAAYEYGFRSRRFRIECVSNFKSVRRRWASAAAAIANADLIERHEGMPYFAARLQSLRDNLPVITPATFTGAQR